MKPTSLLEKGAAAVDLKSRCRGTEVKGLLIRFVLLLVFLKAMLRAIINGGKKVFATQRSCK